MKFGQYIVLSLYEVHMASAAIMVDGLVIAATHEERFTGVKNDTGFPLNAARYCLNIAGIKPEEVDRVAFVNTGFHKEAIANILFKRMALFSNADWIEENEIFWKPTLDKGVDPGDYFELMGGWSRVASGHHYQLDNLDMSVDQKLLRRDFNQLRKKAVSDHLGIAEGKVKFIPHFICHHYHAYYSGHLRGEDVIILHAEGSGENYNQAVSRPTCEGLKVISGTNSCDLGRLYQWMTLYLGMKPYSHEYKLMGLAPHASEHEIARTLEVFDPVFKVNHKKLTIEYNKKPKDLYYHFRRCLQGHRFDGIAGALQKVLELRFEELLDAIIKKTGTTRIAFGGGVAMNVKANKKLSERPRLQDFFVPLSPADESNVFGAGYLLTEKMFLSTNRNPDEIPPLHSPYLGPSFNMGDEKIALNLAKSRGFEVRQCPNFSEVVESLASGKIVARCQGHSEFGQRALGNRSILANPSIPGTVEKINRQIKYRDFWMPFAPSILDSASGKYLKNPKSLSADYMTIAMETRAEYAMEIREALHQADQSARPQIVRAKNNKDYHSLIEAFQKSTGIGALLNTSFNLHGEPIVSLPIDALRVFENSDLDILWFGNNLIKR